MQYMDKKMAKRIKPTAPAPAPQQKEQDARTVRLKELEGPRAQTCLMQPWDYETIPMPPHPPMKW